MTFQKVSHCEVFITRHVRSTPHWKKRVLTVIVSWQESALLHPPVLICYCDVTHCWASSLVTRSEVNCTYRARNFTPKHLQFLGQSISYLSCTPYTMLKKGNSGSTGKAKKSSSSFDASSGVKQRGSTVSNARISQSETSVTARKKRDTFSHSIYDKAAEIYRHLKGEIPASQLPTFDEDLERRRAYSLAFGAKRCKYTLALSENYCTVFRFNFQLI